MADVEIAAPQRCYEIVSNAERLWISLKAKVMYDSPHRTR